MGLSNEKEYGIYNELIKNGYMTIDTHIFTRDNIDNHFNNIINILSDGIETKQVQTMMIHLVFTDNKNVELTIFEYLFNLMMFVLPLEAEDIIDSDKLFWCEDITEDIIAEYINNKFIKKYMKQLPLIEMNQTIDSVFCKFRDIKNFQMYLMNTVNFEDTLDLMNKYPDFNNAVHCNAEDIPIEDVKGYGMKAANTQIEYIINSDHCLRDSFRTGEGINPKQFKEVQANIGSKPNGTGGIFPNIINRSFITGGLATPSDMVIESSIGRQAQILSKKNVGISGNFARLLGLNCMNTSLNNDPDYSCDTKNFLEVFIKDETMLRCYNMRYFRKRINGIDHLLDANKDIGLIGQTLYFRSPMTCNSFVKGKGICYKCYGDLAYINNNINIGKIAAEELSSRFTQRLLSAKHLLESMIRKMQWVGPIFNYLELFVDNLILKSDMDYDGYSILLKNIEMDDEYDNIEYNYHVERFGIVLPDNTVVDIHFADMTDIYLSPEFTAIVLKKMSKIEDEENDIVIPCKGLEDMALFHIEIKNNGLQSTMNEIRKIVNTNTRIATYKNLSELSNAFISTNIKGGIKINAVHFETILANQIRDKYNELEFPDWSIENQNDYIVLSLESSLMKSPYLMSRLLYSKLNKVLITPSTYNITSPSVNDVFAMTNPVKYIKSNPDEISGDNIRDIDDENITNNRKKINPIMIWDNPKDFAKWREKQNKNKI